MIFVMLAGAMLWPQFITSFHLHLSCLASAVIHFGMPPVEAAEVSSRTLTER